MASRFANTSLQFAPGLYGFHDLQQLCKNLCSWFYMASRIVLAEFAPSFIWLHDSH